MKRQKYTGAPGGDLMWLKLWHASAVCSSALNSVHLGSGVGLAGEVTASKDATCNLATGGNAHPANNAIVTSHPSQTYFDDLIAYPLVEK
jgi:hypothetical protein